MNENKSLSIGEASKKYPVGEQTLRNWIDKGDLTSTIDESDKRKRLLIDEAALKKLLTEKGKLDSNSSTEEKEKSQAEEKASLKGADESQPAKKAQKPKKKKTDPRSHEKGKLRYCKNQMRHLPPHELVNVRNWINNRLERELLAAEPAG